MRRVAVDSSVIQSIGYDTETLILEVEFVTGRIYWYFDVPSHAHEELLTAPSIGEYFNHRIRNSYRYKELSLE